MNLFQRFSLPHPFIFTPASTLIPGGATALLLWLFAPFGLSSLPAGKLWLVALGLGAFAAASIWIVVRSLQWGFPSWTDPETWTIGKEFLLISLVVGVIAIGIWGGIMLGGNSQLAPLPLLGQVFLKTLGVSSFPIMILVLFEQFRYQKQKLLRVQALTRQLRQPPLTQSVSPAPPIRLLGENGKLALQLPPTEILFLQSDGNYVEVHYARTAERAEKKLIRNRLKAMVEWLPPEQFFQCHKRYVVNCKHIIRLEGNARQLRLHLRFTPATIPVARSRYDALQAFLTSSQAPHPPKGQDDPRGQNS